MARTLIHRRWTRALVGTLVVLLVGLAVAAAQVAPPTPTPGPPAATPETAATPAASPAGGTPRAIPTGTPTGTPTGSPAGTPAASIPTTADVELSAEEALVLRFAPIMMLKQQPEPCDTDGEQYLPAPVEVVFGDERVVLRQAPSLSAEQTGITGADLYRRDHSHYIDLPGHPRLPGCGYEQHFKQVMGEQRPVIYAHIAREQGQTGLAIQYWFFYYFNEFNDKHEGDWEMIQLLFDDSNTVREAMLYGPTRVAYAQHSGGDPANWTDARVDKVGDRPVVYVASGSHASFFGPGIWLGWGKDGAGLGCDITTGPSVQIDPEVRLIPAEIDGPDHPFAWATFGGRWGERDTWVYNGPNGPNLNDRWTAPVTWHDSVQAGALRLQSAEALGPQPTALFCDLAATGSDLLTLSRPYPWLVGGIIATGLAVVVLFVAVARPIIGAAWTLYRRQFRFFLTLSSLLLPFIIAFNVFLYVLNRDVRLGQALGITEDSPVVQFAAATALALQQGLLMLVIAPATAFAVGEMMAGRQPTVRTALGAAVARFWAIVRVEIWTTVLVFLLTITIVGIPWAIMWGIRWIFTTQTVMLGGQTGRPALRASSNVVRHHWWPTFLTTATLGVAAAAVGPVVGLALLIGLNVSQDITSGVSSGLYALAYPFSTIGATLLYLRLTGAPAPAPVPAAEPSSAAPPAPEPPAPPRGEIAPEPV